MTNLLKVGSVIEHRSFINNKSSIFWIVIEIGPRKHWYKFYSLSTHCISDAAFDSYIAKDYNIIIS